ncbi:MAG: RNA 3'-terminal phosphate cyclase, partial [Maioricimonas sp. JB049]
GGAQREELSERADVETGVGGRTTHGVRLTGNLVTIEIELDALTEVVAGFGERGKPAERVARQAAREAKEFLEAEVPVGQHLADQLLIPLTLGSGGAYLTQPLTPHTVTNIEVIRALTECWITTEALPTRNVRIDVTPGPVASIRQS